MATEMTTVVALKTYFGTDDLPAGTGPARPLDNRKDLIEFRQQDHDGYDRLAEMAAAALGVTLAQPAPKTPAA